MNFPKERFLFKIIQQILISILYFCLLNYASYLFYPVSGTEALIITILISSIQLLCIYVEFVRSNPITRFCIRVLGSLMWFAFMILTLSIAIFLIDSLIFTIPIAINRLFIIVLCVIFIYGYYNAHNPQITERTIYLDNLDEEINLIHISDIHIGSIRTPDILKKVISKINTLDYDVVIISGDIADGSNKINPNDFDEFKKIKKPVIFTPGNHDYYTGIENVFEACNNADIQILDNKQTKIKGLNIYGIGFNNYEMDLEINKDENNLLILHIPTDWDFYINMGFNIILSGHTHGGQFYIAKSFVGLIFPLLRGLYKKGENYINVSDGIGTLDPPIRLGTKSEIGLLKLRKKP